MRAIVTFQGFRESEDHRSGTEDGFFQVTRKFSNEWVTTYHPRDWTSDVKSLARQLARQNIKDVAVISYSHGQAAATAFAKFAYELGIDVPLWLACDPVYRPPWLPRWNIMQPLAFKAMLKDGRIRVPRNIRRVAWVRQTQTRPCGHTLVPSGPNTFVAEPLILPYSHTSIDQAPEWYELMRLELELWLNPPQAPAVES